MKGKRLIIACIAVIATLLIATASVLATNAIIESKSVGVDKALSAALEANQLDATLVEETSIKLRLRDGVAIYIVKIDVENVKYFVTVNAETGEIIETQKNECIRPEKPEKPQKPEDTQEPSDDGERPEPSEKPECPEKPDCDKAPNGGKEFGKGHEKNPHRKGWHGHKGDIVPPTIPEDPEAEV